MKVQQSSLRMLLLLLLLAPAANAQTNEESVMKARSALADFLEAWNAADNSAIQQTLNFPHVTHAPSGLIVAQEPADFVTDFDALRQQGWARSTFDKITATQASERKANFGVEYSRLDASDGVISRGYIYYVVTNIDGHWGMQYRVPGRLPAGAAQLSSAREAAVTMVDDFFAAFNAADNAALLKVNHVPQIMLSAGQFIHAEDVASPIVTMNFERMRENENWHSSELGDFEFINVSENQVIVELSFERFSPDGEHYLTGPAVWVLTRRGGTWGVEFRSLMPPIRHRY